MKEKELKEVYLSMGMDPSHAARKARIVVKREAEEKKKAEAEAALLKTKKG